MALLAVLAMAAGFALPYAVMVVAAQKPLPAPSPPTPFRCSARSASAIPIALIPLFGAALSEGYGEEALLAIAAFIALAGALNVKPADQPLQAEP